MSPWSFKKLELAPIFTGAVLLFGIIMTFIIAVANKNVTPYVPFISEAGGNPPEGGIFSIFLYLSSMIGLFTMTLRFMIISEVNQHADKLLETFNWISLVAGFLSLLGMVIVAAYPVTVVIVAHDIGAYTLFVASLVYGAFQTSISYRMSPSYCDIRICRTRLSLTILSGIVLLIMLISYPIGDSMWRSVPHDHWKGSKTPEDKGFTLLLVSSIAEWSITIFFSIFFFTFFWEFQKTHLHVQVRISSDEADATA